MVGILLASGQDEQGGYKEAVGDSFDHPVVSID